MFRITCLTLVLLGGCHGFFGGRTTEEDQEMAEFAEARTRAATYYDGRDYERAATQFGKALELRPKHFPTRLGYSYSLMFTNEPRNLEVAKEEFEDIGVREDKKEEVKRVYGLAMTHRALAAKLYAQALFMDRKGNLDGAADSIGNARNHAREGLGLFGRVIEIDEALADMQKIAPLRVSASLTPDAHAGMAHCEIILADHDHPNHLKKAIGHIEKFAKVAARARLFWEKKREQVLAIDPMRDGAGGSAQMATLRGRERLAYEARILRTLDQEVAMRMALIEVFIQMGRHMDVVHECDRIQKLDSTNDRVYWLRGQAHASLNPPNYRAALKDLEEYRSRQNLTKLTDDLVRLNRWIKAFQRALAVQDAAGG